MPPAEAQVIFSSVPLWSAGFAWLLLGGEELGPLTWVGGGALVVAGLVASTAPLPREWEEEEEEGAQEEGAQSSVELGEGGLLEGRRTGR